MQPSMNMRYFGMFITAVCLLFLMIVHFIWHLNIDRMVCLLLKIMCVSFEQTFVAKQNVKRRREQNEKREQMVKEEERKKKKTPGILCCLVTTSYKLLYRPS